MASKRGAIKELTHDNWADEDEPEEMGTFRQASTQQLAARQIKKARRRGMGDTSPTTPGVFKSLTPFTGFGSNKDTSSQPTFSFLNKDTSGDSAAKPTFNIFSSSNSNTTANTTKLELTSTGKKTSTQPLKLSQESVSVSPKVSDSLKSNGLGLSKSNIESGGKSGSKQFLAHLKALNEGVLSWVKEHLDKNPHVNLSPVFDDYKKHFEELTKKYPPLFGNESDTDMKNADTKKDEASEKENKPIIEEEASRESMVTPTFSFTAASSAATKSSETEAVSFGTESKAAESKEGTKDSSEKPQFSFGGFGNSKGSKGLMFGDGRKTSGKGFTFGDARFTQSSTTGFTFASNTTSVTSEKDSGQGASADEPTDEPPVVEVTEVKEDDALYEKKCKLFYMKDGAYVEKGVGTLFLKPAGEKTQLVVRALTNLGNILLNIILNASVPTIRAGKNGVIIACIPNPPLDGKDPGKEPIKMLIRVKTSEDADFLLEKINEYKK